MPGISVKSKVGGHNELQSNFKAVLSQNKRITITLKNRFKKKIMVGITFLNSLSEF